MTADDIYPERGWVQYQPMSEADIAARREQARRETDALRASLALAHAAVFGGVHDRSIAEHRMPLSGWLFRWRADGHVQVLRPGEPAEATDWYPWAPPDDAGLTGASEAPAGDSSGPTWWLWWGTCQPADEIHGWLADDRDVAITRLGWIWVAEYVSAPQALFVEHNGKLHTLEPHRPDFLPPAAHPCSRTARNPRQT